MPKWVWPSMNWYRMFFGQTSTLPPSMHQKLSKHGRYRMKNNDLLAKGYAELDDSSITTHWFRWWYQAMGSKDCWCSKICFFLFFFVGWGQRRGWQQSVMELLSPLLMMTLLVWAWSRSTEDHFKAQIYANASLPILSILRQDLLSNSKSLLQLCPADMLAHQVSKHVV